MFLAGGRFAHGDGGFVVGLVEHYLEVAGQGHHGDGAEVFLVRIATELDATFL